jgi:hypothetical protein
LYSPPKPSPSRLHYLSRLRNSKYFETLDRSFRFCGGPRVDAYYRAIKHRLSSIQTLVLFTRSDPRSRRSTRLLHRSITISGPLRCGGLRGMIGCLILLKLALVHWIVRPCGCANLSFQKVEGRTRRNSQLELHFAMGLFNISQPFHAVQSKAVALIVSLQELPPSPCTSLTSRCISASMIRIESPLFCPPRL